MMVRSQDSVFKMTGLLDGLTATDAALDEESTREGACRTVRSNWRPQRRLRGEGMRQQWTLGGGFVPGAAIGDYHVLGLLGVGGMGRVYRVRHLLSKRVEAMKLVLPDVHPRVLHRALRKGDRAARPSSMPATYLRRCRTHTIGPERQIRRSGSRASGSFSLLYGAQRGRVKRAARMLLDGPRF